MCPEANSYFPKLGTFWEAAPAAQLLANNVPVHAAAATTLLVLHKNPAFLDGQGQKELKEGAQLHEEG